MAASLATRLKQIVSKLSKTRVLVIGDLMWDEYVWGECSRVSEEAPVPVVKINREERVPGGATNVLKNLHDLNVGTGIIGVVGADKGGREMIRELNKWNLKMVQIWESPDRPTISKMRILARNQQVVRLDREETHAISKNMENRILKHLEQNIKSFDAIILSDYDKGVFTPNLIKGIISIARANKVYTAVDPQVRLFKQYVGADLMTPNEKEAAGGMQVDKPAKESEVKKLGEQIKKELNLTELIITRSAKGMALFSEKDKSPIYVPAVAREVYDVSGAGDTVVAVYTAALASGARPLDAAILATLASGVVVGKLGTASIKRKELQAMINAEHIKKVAVKE